MTDRVERKLAELGLTLPEPAPPVAAYVPAVEAGGLLHISGQLPFDHGQLMTGRLGDDRDLAYGQEAAERCALMLVAQIKAALGGLHRVGRIVKLGVFVSSAADFTDQPKVANGASELMVALFGDAGKHALVGKVAHQLARVPGHHDGELIEEALVEHFDAWHLRQPVGGEAGEAMVLGSQRAQALLAKQCQVDRESQRAEA